MPRLSRILLTTGISPATALGEELSYHEWLAENSRAMERITGKQGGLLKEILPKIGTRYRQLIITWASDPQSVDRHGGLAEEPADPGELSEGPLVKPRQHVNPYIAGSPVTGTEMFYGREGCLLLYPAESDRPAP